MFHMLNFHAKLVLTIALTFCVLAFSTASFASESNQVRERNTHNRSANEQAARVSFDTKLVISDVSGVSYLRFDQNSSLDHDLQLEAGQKISLANELEDKFATEITIYEIANCKTVQDVIDVVQEKVNSQVIAM